MEKVAIVEFISASTAGVVNVSLGFKPDFVLLIADHGGTNPNMRFWVNNARFSGWAVALSLLLLGSTGVVTRDTTGITAQDGNVTVPAQTENSDPKHLRRTGTIHATGDQTSEGIAIPADHQVNSGRNVILCFRSSL